MEKIDIMQLKQSIERKIRGTKYEKNLLPLLKDYRLKMNFNNLLFPLASCLYMIIVCIGMIYDINYNLSMCYILYIISFAVMKIIYAIMTNNIPSLTDNEISCIQRSIFTTLVKNRNLMLNYYKNVKLKEFINLFHEEITHYHKDIYVCEMGYNEYDSIKENGWEKIKYNLTDINEISYLTMKKNIIDIMSDKNMIVILVL